jgi:hypothetical protein
MNGTISTFQGPFPGQEFFEKVDKSDNFIFELFLISDHILKC